VGSDLWLLETIASLDISMFVIICEFCSKIIVQYPPMNDIISDISYTPPEIKEAENVFIAFLV
jgi:hypothetical protein